MKETTPAKAAEAAWHEGAQAHLGPGEQPLARGIVYPLKTLEGELYGSWAYVLVSTKRILWQHKPSPDHVSELDLDLVRSYSEGLQHHRQVLLLRHDPIDRVDLVPKRLLGIQWGNERRPASVTETIFMFSRVGTQVADAITEQLSLREVPRGEALTLDERSREERTRGSHVLLRADESSERSESDS